MRRSARLWPALEPQNARAGPPDCTALPNAGPGRGSLLDSPNAYDSMSKQG